MASKSIPYFTFYPEKFMGGVRGLSAQEVGVYTMLLCRMYEEDGPVEYHTLRLSTYCGMREKTFAAVAEKLMALGKITMNDGMIFNARAAIEIADRADKLKNNSKAGKVSAEKRQGNQGVAATAVQQPFNHIDRDIDKKKEIGKPISAHDEKFDDFWQQYPHRNGAKKGKASAQKAWGAAIRARASPDDIIGGAMRYANDRQVVQGYAKDPATWINQKGWNDDIEPDHPRAPPGASIGGPRRPHDSMVAGFAFVANQHARRQEPD